MDDFLYNLRKEAEKRNRRHSNMQQQYKRADRGASKDRRNYNRKSDNNQLAEILSEIKTLLATITINQNRKADIEERKADVLKNISDQFNALLSTVDRFPETIKSTPKSKDECSEDTHVKEYFNYKSRDEVTNIVLKMRGEGKTYKKIAHYLEVQNIPTFSKKGEWHAQTIHKIYKQVVDIA